MTSDERAELARLRDECARLRDEHERKDCELAELSASEAQYREFVERAQEGIWVIDADERTTLVNPCMAQMIGYEVDDILGRKLQSFTDDEGVRTTDRNIERRKNGIAETLDFTFVHRQGHNVLVRVNTWPLFDDDGTYRGAIGFMVDRSEERRLEERLERAQKMESLAVMAGGVAHDFNNLLVGVLANAALARRMAEGNDQLQELLEQVEHAARSAAELTRQMLTYAGRSSPRATTFDVGDAVRDIEALVRAALPKGVSVRITTPDEPALVRADTAQLRQVVMNLILNAAESFGGRSGEVDVRVAVREVSHTELTECWIDDDLPGGQYVCIDVIDAGCGMDAETQTRIFEPFFTTRETGRGLGLASVLGIVRAHRGGLRVDSSPGRGTTMRVLLPAGAEEVGRSAARTASGPLLAVGGRVLVVDDERIVRDVARRVLESGGWDVTCAANATEAMDRLEAELDTWVAVVLDVTMPDRSGVDVLHDMVRLRPDIPVVLSTGYATASLTDVGEAAAVLEKPWDPRALLRTVRNVVNARRRR